MQSTSQRYSVSELTFLIKQNLENNFPNITVYGEVSGLSKAMSGHLYFTLKDDKAIISCVLFQGAAKKLPFQLENGQEILLQGSLALYAPRGNYQIIVEKAKPIGDGALQLAFEQLKTKLHQAGYFSQERKKKLPLYPKKIGIITSRTGAVIEDMLKVIFKRNDQAHVILNPVLVQGKTAAEEISKAIEYFQQTLEVDVIIVARGGGSIEDFWAFNEESVAQALFQCQIPIISAIGHETDFTIADFVADVRAATPSVAAEMVIIKKDDAVAHIDSIQDKLITMAQNKLRLTQLELDHLTSKIKSPQNIIDIYQEKINKLLKQVTLSHYKHHNRINDRWATVDFKFQEQSYHLQNRIQNKINSLKQCQDNLILRMKSQFEKKKIQFENKIMLLNSLNPLEILKRGYTITEDDQGKKVHSTKQLKIDDILVHKTKDGRFKSQVKHIFD